jgi:uncharacterized protein (DUF924 family)
MDICVSWLFKCIAEIWLAIIVFIDHDPRKIFRDSFLMLSLFAKRLLAQN